MYNFLPRQDMGLSQKGRENVLGFAAGCGCESSSSVGCQVSDQQALQQPLLLSRHSFSHHIYCRTGKLNDENIFVDFYALLLTCANVFTTGFALTP